MSQYVIFFISGLWLQIKMWLFALLSLFHIMHQRYDTKFRDIHQTLQGLSDCCNGETEKTCAYTKLLTSNCFPVWVLFRLGYSQNYMSPILVPSSAKHITTQILVIAKLNGTKDFIFRGFVCDIICPGKALSIQS